MKVKNDYVIIKNGHKTYEFKNLILNDYLQRFVKRQLSDTPNNNRIRANIGYIYLKFDTPLSFNENSTLYDDDFDISIIGDMLIKQDVSVNQISVQYDFFIRQTDFIRDLQTLTTSQNITAYYNRKITAIGFASWWGKANASVESYKVMAVLDTKNFNIKLQNKQDFSITRKDIISTDAFFYSNDLAEVNCPVHLVPTGIDAILPPTTQTEEKCYGKLYSWGLSNRTDQIQSEEITIEDEGGRFILENDTSVELSMIFREHGLYPKTNLYPSTSLYPDADGYKYVVIKYKVMQNGTTYTDTGKWYLQCFPATDYDWIKAIISYERG